MPWTTDDVSRFKSGLTQAQKRQWVRIANSALQSCLDNGGSQSSCEASAIRQANGSVGNNTVANTTKQRTTAQYRQTTTPQSNHYTTTVRQHQGENHIVVPVVMMVEGVHSGSHGPLLHLGQDLGRFTGAWNGIPVVVNHPEEDGVGVSANSPDIVDEQVVGRVYNTRFEDGKLRAEAWVNENKVSQVSPEVLTYLRSGRPLDVSLGVFTEDEPTSGEFNGEEYTAIARNHRPDHLAMLPGMQGACSWEDGCGVRANKSNVEKEIDVEQVQMNRRKWTQEQAKNWLREHDFKVSNVERQANYWSFRQESPGQYSEFRADKSPFGFDEGDGVIVIYGIKTKNGKRVSEIQTIRFYHGKSDEPSQQERKGGKHLTEENQFDPIKTMKEYARKGYILQVNEQGYRELASVIQSKLDTMDSDIRVHYLEELYEDYFVYQISRNEGGPSRNTLYKRSYVTNEDGTVEFGEDTASVVKKVEYVEQQTQMKRTKNNKGGETPMVNKDTKEKVELLIQSENNSFGEDEREWLSGLDQAQIEKLEAMEQTIETNKKKEPEKGDGPQMNKEQATQILKDELSDPEKFKGIVPNEVRQQLDYGDRLHKEHRQKLVGHITTNAVEGAYTKEELEAKETDDLEKLAKAIKPKTDYSAFGGDGAGTYQQGQEEILPPPGVKAAE